jgi:TPR repeat protein
VKKLLVCIVALACNHETRVEVPVSSAPACTSNDLDGEPLVVDLRADKRAELETAMSHGIVAIRYDCSGVHVLPDCVAKGDYAWSGVTEKEELVRFSTPAELRANFPTSGDAIARDHAGSDVALAMALVGSRSAQRAGLHGSDFTGTCTGATHYVQRAAVGAFGMRFVPRGAKVDAPSVIASGDTHDGSLDACRASTSATDRPPNGCASPLRVVLRPVDRDEPPPESSQRRCREGTVLADDGSCRAPDAITYHLCVPEQLADCEAQCDKGSMGSCAIAGRAYQTGRGVQMDIVRATKLFDRACTGGSMQGCHRLGEIELQSGSTEKARQLFEKSCNTGWLPACESFGQLGLSSPAAKVDVATVFKRSCAGGNFESCASLGKLYETGIGIQQNDTEAVRLYELACASGQTRRSCVSLSVMVERGRGTPADPARSNAILERACTQQGSSDSCGMLSLHYFEGRGVPRDGTKGVEFLVKACEGTDLGSCLPLAMRYQAGVGVPKDPERAKKYFTRACDSGLSIACEQIRH